MCVLRVCACVPCVYVMCVMCVCTCVCMWPTSTPGPTGATAPRGFSEPWAGDMGVQGHTHDGCILTPKQSPSHSSMSGLCSHKSCGFQKALKWENLLKYHVGDPCTTWWKWRGSSWSRAGSPPRASRSPPDTSGGPRSPCEDPHSAGSFDAHRVEGLLGCPGLLCGCECDYGTEQIPTLPAAAGLWGRVDTKPSVFPEGWHCWWLDKYTHTHTPHTESITSKVNQGAVTLSSENTPSVLSRGCMAQDRNGQRIFLFLLAPLSDVLARRLLTMAGGTKDHMSQFLLTFPHVSSQSSVHCDAFSKYLHLNHLYLYMCSVYFAAKDQGWNDLMHAGWK